MPEISHSSCAFSRRIHFYYDSLLTACLTHIGQTKMATSNVGFNTLRPRQNGRHFADDIFKCIFLNENVWIPIKISMKFVPKGPINNIPSLVQIMVWRRPGAKPLSEPMMVSLLTHLCVTRPQWVKTLDIQISDGSIVCSTVYSGAD